MRSKLTSEQVHTFLKGSELSGTVQDGGIYVAVVLEPDSSWARIGRLRRGFLRVARQ